MWRKCKKSIASRANAQTIHIRPAYMTSSQSSPLHNKPSRTTELLHATLWQTDCTISSFPVPLWPLVNINLETNRLTAVLTHDDVTSLFYKITLSGCIIGFYRYSFLCLAGCFSMIIWTTTVLSVLYACALYFCICTCSSQLSMFHMERRSRNTLIIIIIIIIICAK